jgi:hypothetical protein
MVGYALWALFFVGMLVLEGLGLTLHGHTWPTVSDLFRSATRPTVGRWLFFALWVWIGWHFFIRGWAFFLQGKSAGAPSSSDRIRGVGATITQVIVPLGVLAAMLGSLLVISYRNARSSTVAPREILRRFPRFVRERPRGFAVFTLATTVAGYVIFVASMGAYELVVGRSAGGIFGSAAAYGAFLVFAVALPAFAVLTIVAMLVASLRAREDGTGTPDLTEP